MNGDELDLSGMWHGFFNYPTAQPPVAFTATLIDSGGALSGATHETGQIGAASGLAITATLQGRRSHRSVTWLKIYDADFKQYDTVHYAGDISADGLEIEGRWTVPGNWSGTFLMIRAGSIGKAVETGISVTVSRKVKSWVE